jgi:preprotein translocase subunit SecA
VIKGIGRKLFGSQNERELKRFWPLVQQINALEANYKKMSDVELQNQTIKFRERIERGESLDSILPEAFSTVREASVRTLGMRHFDVQMIGGMVLHQGKIAEMKTGEGKTLCATLPVYLNALPGKGVHVVTVNDYLATRDSEWMGIVYNFLGLSSGVVVNNMGFRARHQAYRADITYGQNNEFGFDYLRDNMKHELSEKVQRDYFYAIVDEVDSILIDEARTPLIISGPSEAATDKYNVADQVVRKLLVDQARVERTLPADIADEDKAKEVYYTIEPKSKQVSLTEKGVTRVEEILSINNLYDPEHIEMVHHVTQSLKAHAGMEIDIDYVVRDNEVIIVDEFTGRLMSGRRWSDGLHQAVEAKEGVEIARENQTLATITFQNYFRMYKKLSGMTGTADTEAVEFKKIYNLDVVAIPTNKPMLREDHPDVIFSGKKGKYNAVCNEIKELQEKGQPVLVGTANIANSEMLSTLLQKRGVKHNVLNAKQHEREAEIVAQAGRVGSVTISTNMAGRGTDIVLGGNPEFLALAEVGAENKDTEEYQERFRFYKAQCEEEKKKVIELGGLHILGTERHESRRIDNQLRGRSGRQGDPGSSRFYVSLEDDLMLRFGGEKMKAIMTRVGMKEDDAVEGLLVGRAVENAQKKVEGYHFDLRKHLLEYDDVLNKQREVIYSTREKVLKAENISEEIQEMVPDLIEEIIESRASEKTPTADWDIKGMFVEFRRQFGLEDSGEEFIAKQARATKDLAQEIFDHVLALTKARYEERRARFGEEALVKLERIVYLQAIDQYWREQLANIDHLKEGIGLRGYGQKNPLHEYQREAYLLFTEMMLGIKSSVLQHVFLAELISQEQLQKLEEAEKERQRREEEAAKASHASILDASSGNDGDASGLNRKQRRNRDDSAHDSEHQIAEIITRSKSVSKNKRKAQNRARKGK